MRTRPFTRRALRAAAVSTAGCLLLAGCSSRPASLTDDAGTGTAIQPGGPVQGLSPLPHTHEVAVSHRGVGKRHRRPVRPTTTTVPVTTRVVPTKVSPDPIPPSTSAPDMLIADGYADCPGDPAASLARTGSRASVTVIGDSVTLDWAPNLAAYEPGTQFAACVGQQWYQGVADVQQLRAANQLGQTVVISLGTNGPISSSDFVAMMGALAGVPHVVFVTDYVNENWTDWQDANNEVIEAGAARYANVAVANWYAVAVANPEWFTPNGGPHVAIGGVAAQAAAALIVSKI